MPYFVTFQVFLKTSCAAALSQKYFLKIPSGLALDENDDRSFVQVSNKNNSVVSRDGNEEIELSVAVDDENSD